MIGGGPAGIAAAAAAYDAGLQDTLILERGNLPGGRLRERDEPEAGVRVFHRPVGSHAYYQRFQQLLAVYEIPCRKNCNVIRVDVPRAEGKFRLTVVERNRRDEPIEFAADLVILACGSSSGVRFPSAKASQENGLPEVSERLASSIPGMFLAGDILSRKALPDEASLEGARAGRSAAEDFLERRRSGNLIKR